MDQNQYISKVDGYLNSILPAMGYALDSVTWTRENNEWYLRAYIMKSDGTDMTVNDCAAVSRRLSKWLDQKDFIPEQYMLEVCSMGFKDEPADADDSSITEDNNTDTVEA